MSPASLPVSLAPGDGGIYARGMIVGSDPGGGGSFVLLVDTGTVFTTRAVGMSGTEPIGIVPLTLQLLDGAGTTRAQFDAVPMLESPLAPVGVNGKLLHLEMGGILGGDLLQRFSVLLDYTPAGPSIALRQAELTCSCALADKPSCAAVLPFKLAGGGTLAIRDEVRSYPATRVTVDACLEPVTDPVGRGVPCVGADGAHQRGYEAVGPPGVDVKLLVATGFPGVLLGAKVYDRLRCPGAAAALLAHPTDSLYFAGNPAPVPAARAWLGGGGASPVVDGGTPGSDAGLSDGGGGSGGGGDFCGDGGAGGALASSIAALVLVGREGLLGACGELARSRRLRYTAGHLAPPMIDPFATALVPRCGASDPSCPRPAACTTAANCINNTPCDLQTHLCKATSCLLCVPGSACAPGSCNDARQPAAASVELTDAIPIYVVDDNAPILLEVNDDVFPVLPVIEGVVGTELLARLSAQIDYPNNRIIARCADYPGAPTGCTVYPRYVCQDQVGDCGPRGTDSSQLCNEPRSICPYGPAGGTLCRGAPINGVAGACN